MCYTRAHFFKYEVYEATKQLLIFLCLIYLLIILHSITFGTGLLFFFIFTRNYGSSLPFRKRVQSVIRDMKNSQRRELRQGI